MVYTEIGNTIIYWMSIWSKALWNNNPLVTFCNLCFREMLLGLIDIMIHSKVSNPIVYWVLICLIFLCNNPLVVHCLFSLSEALASSNDIMIYTKIGNRVVNWMGIWSLALWNNNPFVTSCNLCFSEMLF